MEYIQLSNSDIKVSRICMGGCPMGGYGWGNTNEDSFINAINIALDRGINFFDTANTYGFGQSEETLSKGLSNRRKDVIIQSKFGVRVMQDMVGKKTIYDNSPQYIKDALEGTLKRLNSDYIDIYTIHYRDKTTNIDDVIDTLDSLKKEGKIRYFGLSNLDDSTLKEILPYKNKFVCCQNEFSLACRKNGDILKFVCNSLGITPLTWGSLGQGILTGKYSGNVKFDSNDRRHNEIYVNFHGEKLYKNLKIVEELKILSNKYNKPVSSIAIRFILDYLDCSIALVGAKNKDQMLDNLTAVDWKLSEDDVKMLDEVSKD